MRDVTIRVLSGSIVGLVGLALVGYAFHLLVSGEFAHWPIIVGFAYFGLRLVWIGFRIAPFAPLVQGVFGELSTFFAQAERSPLRNVSEPMGSGHVP